ncbi:MAG: PilZ domain-containing protein [Sphingomonas sp.]|uniref:PilZ domain-containing protein n=1 Tax=Sphingomonas sp. TaxID=28214 RepID=UPI0025E78547|nr:PilZ domain-containing protein [Sphingomonas sp.]MBX9882389.1 PilZ domain-containing protein [Sphingomonas sp.]
MTRQPMLRTMGQHPARREERHEQEGRSIQLLTNSVVHRFDLHNLSGFGASGAAEVALAPGATIELLFENGHRIGGRVRWHRDALIGIEFFNRLPLDVLHGRGQSERVARAPRYRVARVATIAVNGISRAATIRNVSRGGMMIETALPLLPGQRIEISTGELGGLCAQVRWSRNGRAGVQLTQALSIDEFDAASARGASAA